MFDEQATYEVRSRVITAGDTSTPTVLELLLERIYKGAKSRIRQKGGLRLHVCNDGTFTNATNATIAPVTGWGTTRTTHSATKELTIDTPAAGVNASGVLTISGVVVDGETASVGGRTYYFSTGATDVPSGNVAVDISAGGTKAQGTLTLIAAPTAGDTLRIGSTVYTYKATPTLPGDIGVGAAAVAEVTDITVVGGSVAQIETFTTVADVADSLDGTFFQLSDEDGTVGIWIDTDDSGTTIPAGASALDRALEVTTIATNDTAEDVATKVAAVINADSKFSASAVGAVVTVTHATAGAVGDGVDGDTGFTAFTVTTNGTTHTLDGKYFILQDTDGTVAFWIDTDNSGTTIPAGASAADRAVEITTVTSVMTTNTLATTIAAAINADSKFSASAVGAVMTVTNAEVGQFGSAADGDTGFTPFTITTPGVSATAQANTVAAINGTDGLNSANLEATIAAFVDNDAVITARYTGTAGNSIVTTETFTSGSNVFDAGTLGTTTAGVDVSAAQAGAALETAVNNDSSAPFTASDSTGTVTFTADVVGPAANDYTTTDTMANGSFASGTFTGGVTDENGVIRVSITNATAETVSLRLGPPAVGGVPADYSAPIQITHAAP